MDATIALGGSGVDTADSPLDLDQRQDSLVGRIASDIAREIADGRLAPGADLNSVELAARFATSRTPVREALMLLEKEGLVEIPPRRRPRVARISLAEIGELYEIRAMLNSMMMREYLKRATTEILSGAQTQFERMKDSAQRSDIAAFLKARSDLHNYWVDHCGNASLQRLLRGWKMRLSVTRLGGDVLVEKARILSDHERMMVACAERDIALAETLIASMTRFGLAMIRQQQGSRETPASG